MIKEIRVASLGDLLDRATPRKPDPASGRLRDTAVYRGVSEAGGRLLTSLDRLGGIEPPHSKGHLEEHLLRNFLRYGRPFLEPRQRNFWELMVIAEHHGLPTRLLDWTHSPLIAAHFTTLNPAPRGDRVIWKLDWRRMHQGFGLKPVAFLVEDLDAELANRGRPAAWGLLQNPLPDAQHFACLLDPPAVTNRLAVQSGAFTLCSSKDRSLDQLLAQHGLESVLTRFILPAESVEHIRDQLDLCTVDERRLFPGLDGIAAELKRYYSYNGPLSEHPTLG